ncbi:uncharacterized protein Dvir_GJ26523 [Drosophila virilis]|uniref:Uncharacterized protein n=1 Tax=Drosophila virilis TaxID=7244 RepID=A0A0Q9WJR7_DROVI|nr:tyrosine-protein phosphatase 99A [Drosophila virilis]KRF85021.1 uncharacterized protein Dvir_GJ26523 [Drosophila virilis]
MEYSNSKCLNHNEPQQQQQQQQHEQHEQQTRLIVLGSYFRATDTPTANAANEATATATAILGSQRCPNTPPTTPSSPLRDPPQSPSDGQTSSLSSHSGSSDILLGE